MQTPSNSNIPTVSLVGDWTSHQGTGTKLASYSASVWPLMTFVNNFKSAMLWHAGPHETLIETWPGAVVRMPPFGILSELGRMEYRPLKAAGALIEPPISDNGPIGLPFSAINAPSPQYMPILHIDDTIKRLCYCNQFLVFVRETNNLQTHWSGREKFWVVCTLCSALT